MTKEALKLALDALLESEEAVGIIAWEQADKKNIA